MMSTDSGIPSGSEGQQLAQARQLSFLERLHQLKLEGAKGLVTLNGGAAVAMLAFVQALTDRSGFYLFKPFALWSLALFLAGAFLAGIAFFFQYSYVLYGFYQHKVAKKVWQYASWGVLVVAAIAALVGGLVVVLGIQRAL